MIASKLSGCLWLLLVAQLGAGCSSDVNPVKAAFVDAGYGPKTMQAPDFVEKTRTDDKVYMPVGVSAPKRTRARSAEEQKSLESELSGARDRNDARGRAAEGAAKSAAKGLKPAPVE